MYRPVWRALFRTDQMALDDGDFVFEISLPVILVWKSALFRLLVKTVQDLFEHSDIVLPANFKCSQATKMDVRATLPILHLPE